MLVRQAIDWLGSEKHAPQPSGNSICIRSSAAPQKNINLQFSPAGSNDGGPRPACNRMTRHLSPTFHAYPRQSARPSTLMLRTFLTATSCISAGIHSLHPTMKLWLHDQVCMYTCIVHKYCLIQLHIGSNITSGMKSQLARNRDSIGHDASARKT